MRRERIPIHNISDMTMSMMHQKQSEACETRLLAYPVLTPFDPSATDADTQRFLEYSYTEYSSDGLMTLKQLKKQITKRLQLEAKFLSPGEVNLLEALLDQDGEILIEDWDDLSAVESLIKRLYCTVKKEGDELVLRLPYELQSPIARIFQQQKTKNIRNTLLQLDATIQTVLYINGFILAEEVCDCITKEIMHRSDLLALQIAKRYLMSAYEYETDMNGNMLLLHPGLSSAAALIIDRLDQGLPPGGFLSEAGVMGIGGVFPQEIPLLEGLCGTLIGALRPEYEPMEAVQDLHMLIKQGAGLEECRHVLSTMLAVMPTQNMFDRLDLLYHGTPRWAGMETPILH